MREEEREDCDKDMVSSWELWREPLVEDEALSLRVKSPMLAEWAVVECRARLGGIIEYLIVV